MAAEVIPEFANVQITSGTLQAAELDSPSETGFSECGQIPRSSSPNFEGVVHSGES